MYTTMILIKNEYHCDYAETFKLTLFYGKN